MAVPAGQFIALKVINVLKETISGYDHVICHFQMYPHRLVV